MKRQRDLEQRLRSLETLYQAVSAMKSLSAQQFRACRAALEPAREYRRDVDQVLESVNSTFDGITGATENGPVGILVIGAEMGFCGGYNARLAAAGAKHRSELGPGPTLCMGQRAARILGRRDVEIDKVYSGPTSVDGVTDALLTLAQDMLQTFVTARLSGFDVVASRFEGVGSVHPETTRLLPLEWEHVEGAPRPRYAEAEHLTDVAVRELLYSMMVELLLDALASEQGARLVATQAAEQWLLDRKDRVRRRLASARREATTQEVIEISSGARAGRGNTNQPGSGD